MNSTMAPRPDDDWECVGEQATLGANFPLRVRVGEKPVLIFHANGRYRGIQAACPHMLASLADGVLMAGGTQIRCPRHNYIFRLSDGKGVNCPGYRADIYDVLLLEGRFHACPASKNPKP